MHNNRIQRMVRRVTVALCIKIKGTLNMRGIYLISTIILAILIAGCATTSTKIYPMSERTAICSRSSDNLGHIAVLAEAAWRDDQKEPAKRELMALEEIKKAFDNFPCGSLSAPGGVREFAKWSRKSESKLLKNFSNEGVDTIILLRMEELTPRLFITLSLPVLFGGSNEADFRIRMLSVKTGEVLVDMRVLRSTGGPFNIRPAEWARDELRAALHDIIWKELSK
jgi:hypothetical protein